MSMCSADVLGYVILYLMGKFISTKYNLFNLLEETATKFDVLMYYSIGDVYAEVAISLEKTLFFRLCHV